MVMVYAQRQDSDQKFKELNGEVTLSKPQLESMVETIRIFSEEVGALKNDVDKKREKRENDSSY